MAKQKKADRVRDAGRRDKKTGDIPAAGTTPSIRLSWTVDKVDPDFPSRGGKKADWKFGFELREFLANLREHPIHELQAGKVSELDSKHYVRQSISEMDDESRSKIERRIQKRNLNGLTHWVRLRLGGKKRVYATVPDSSGKMDILWIDPEHQIWSGDR